VPAIATAPTINAVSTIRFMLRLLSWLLEFSYAYRGGIGT